MAMETIDAPKVAPDLAPAGDPGHDRYAAILLALYLAWWLALAVAPWYRADWLLENVLVFVGLPIILWVHRRLSRAALAALFVFLVLHAVGAHYTYAEVPYDAWARALTGDTLSSALGLERNHFDRLVHFLYGLLVTPAVTELLDQRVASSGIWRYLLPFTLMSAQASIYEIIEWAAAEVFGGDLGQAYLGTQGDVWDAQKDSALMILGVLLAVLVLRLRKPRARGAAGAAQA